MAVAGNRVTEFLVDGALGALLVAGAIYVLLRIFRRDRGDRDPPRGSRF